MSGPSASRPGRSVRPSPLAVATEEASLSRRRTGNLAWGDEALGADRRAVNTIARGLLERQADQRRRRRLDATLSEQDAVQKVTAPRRAVQKRVRQRAQVGNDSATPERTAKAEGDERIGQDGTQRISDAPLDSLRSREVITLEQFEAGDRYREDCWTAGMVRSPVSDLHAVGSGFGPRVPGFVASESKASAMDRVNAADDALGAGLRDVVKAVALATAGDTVKDIGIRLFGRKSANEARAALVEVLRLGLNRLAVHYAPPPRTRMRVSRNRDDGDLQEVS